MSVTHNLDQILEIGRRRGRLTVDDLSKYLPIEHMSAAELTETIAAIENAGVTIDIDPDFLKGRPRLVEPIEPNPPTTGTDAVEDGHERLAELDSSIRQSQRQIRPARDTGRYKGGTVFVAIAAVVCALVVIAVWLVGGI
jgi:hypothetical protein